MGKIFWNGWSGCLFWRVLKWVSTDSTFGKCAVYGRTKTRLCLKWSHVSNGWGKCKLIPCRVISSDGRRWLQMFFTSPFRKKNRYQTLLVLWEAMPTFRLAPVGITMKSTYDSYDPSQWIRSSNKTVASASKSHTGWWFGTFFIFPYIGIVIIPIDFNSNFFQRGRSTTNHIHRYYP